MDLNFSDLLKSIILTSINFIISFFLIFLFFISLNKSLIDLYLINSIKILFGLISQWIILDIFNSWSPKNKEFAIFPANKEDLITDFNDMKADVQKDIGKKEEELSLMKSNFAWLEEKIEKNKAEELTTPKFEEIGA